MKDDEEIPSGTGGRPAWLEQARAKWQHRGFRRPPFAVEPGPGQESVWDYPRPPALVADDRWVEVRLADVLVARTNRALRVLETSHPPTFYLPRSDVVQSSLRPVTGRSFCEWKGPAAYYDVVVGSAVAEGAAWSYEDPFDEMRELAGHVSFYPSRVECFVDGDRVEPQAGSFYGGWVTKELVGPFKGQPGTEGW